MEHSSTLRLPFIDVDVCRIGFGCEALGGFNWGDVDVPEIEFAIEYALTTARDAGQAVLFDTSDTYGPYLSEERLGEALSGVGKTAVIASKFGVRLQDGKAFYDTSVDWADQALDDSLKRLKRDCIELYQLHWPDQATPLTTTLDALEGFRADGRIKSYGVCNVPPSELLGLTQDYAGLVSFSQSYSLIDRKQRSDIRTLCDRGLTFLAYGCLAQGLLSGKYDSTTRFGKNDRRSNPKYHNFHGDRLANNLKVIDTLKAQADRLNRPPATVALQFVLTDLPGAIALAGIKSDDQWRGNLTALESTLPDDVYATLNEASHEAAL